ncbi:septum site-determining protein MinC [Conchiformibius steedae]|uniref:Probable septum site-determining protein MinC n=1 Tax=Conchiformibius steedae TaxID=153493 RepID=A0A3P2A2X3_9NEIS|nr:septum site-determining protein MinC [Conchiformibius steedae]RRD89679.1 septum site-determining protein MinC [Conchiformibius steedae]
MKPAFNVKSARLDALAVQLHDCDLAQVRETLQQNIEKYIRFKSLPFVLDISAVESPENLPIGEIAALFALYEINIVALRHSDAAVAALAAKHELSFVAAQRSEVSADLEAETRSADAENTESEEADTEGYEAVAEEENAKPVRDDDMLYNDNDAVKTVEMAKEADLLDVTAEPPATSMDVADAPETETACEKVSVNASKPTIVVSAPVRTGQQIYAEQADLIVLGSVSPGAEVIADGNIHIYAPLRGRALAGASGDTNARIFVQSMQAELVSIAGIYRVFEQSLPQHLHRKPVQIELHDDRLAIGAIHTE